MVVWKCPEHEGCVIVSEPGEVEEFSRELVETSPFIEYIETVRLGVVLVIGAELHERVVYRVTHRRVTGSKIEPTLIYYGERIA